MSLRVSDLRVAYGKRAPVLEGLSFEVPAGQVSLLLGPNASGKSSLIKAMAGVEDYEGEIVWEGQELRGMPRKQRAQSLAYVPQVTELRAALGVRRVVAMARYAHDESPAQTELQVQAAMEQAGCASLAERSFSTLSGGQRQQVLLARALATQAKVLLLDEPSAALDIGHTLLLGEQLCKLAEQGYTVLWAMHDLHLAHRFGDHCVLLHEGGLAAQGSVQRVLEPSMLKRVYGVQLRVKDGPGFYLEGGGQDAR